MAEVTEYVVGLCFAGGKDVGWERVALLQKARPDWQKGRLNGPGGRVEPGETPRQAMVREFRQEAGVVTFESDWQLRLVLHCRTCRVSFFWTWLLNIAPLKFRPGETDEPCGWYDTAVMQPHVIPNLRWIIPLVKDRDLRFPIEIHDDSDPAVDGATVREGRPVITESSPT